MTFRARRQKARGGRSVGDLHRAGFRSLLKLTDDRQRRGLDSEPAGISEVHMEGVAARGVPTHLFPAHTSTRAHQSCARTRGHLGFRGGKELHRDDKVLGR